MKVLGRRMLQVLSAAALLVPFALVAQDFPSRPIRLVVPYAPTGLPDVLSRLVAAKVTESTGQQVIVENKPGAGGSIAYSFAAKAAPDGYTVLLASDADYAITPALQPKLPYDPPRDFAPVTQALRGAFFLVANSSLGVNSVPELIALAKARPGINYGSPGSGQSHHLAMAQFAAMSGVNLTHVPYKGVVQATPALLSGEVSIMFTTLTSVISHVRSDNLRVLAVSTAQRSPLMPEIPTVAESGLPGFDIGITMGFVVPAGTPRPIVERLNMEFVKAMKAPDTASKLAGFSMEVVAGTPEQFAEQLRKDQHSYPRLVRQIGLKMD